MNMSAALSVAASALVGVGLSHAGDLNPPPGPVGPTMKTLDDVEPRIPLNPEAAPITITQPGSYYLTGNLIAPGFGENAITINVADVTLDLAGHMIANSEVGEWAHGVFVQSGASNVTVTNGTIRGSAQQGIHSEDDVSDGRFIDLRLIGNHNGLWVGTRAQIDRCIAVDNANFGFLLRSGAQIMNSIASGNGVTGIVGSSRSMIRDCVANGNGLHGIEVTQRSVARGNHCEGNTGSGIMVLINRNRILENNCIGNETGIRNGAQGSANVVTGNTCIGNAQNYDLQPGDDVGPIGPAATATSPWANISG